MVTKSVCAISLLLIPSAASCTTRRSLAVSASSPVYGTLRGLGRWRRSLCSPLGEHECSEPLREVDALPEPLASLGSSAWYRQPGEAARNASREASLAVTTSMRVVSLVSAHRLCEPSCHSVRLIDGSCRRTVRRDPHDHSEQRREEQREEEARRRPHRKRPG